MPKLILAYHGVGDYQDEHWIEYGERKYSLKGLSVLPDAFENQLIYLQKRGYHSVSLKDNHNLVSKSVAITFDDGFRNFFDFARPLLKKYGYTATIFLVTDKIQNNDPDFLSWEQVLQLQKEGFSFGAHTCSHAVLTSLPLERAKHEIEESKRVIEEKLANPVKFFSYPYGAFNPAIQTLVREAGFLGAVVTPAGPGSKEGPYALKRVGINRNNSMFVFKLKVSGIFSWLRERKLLWSISKWFNK